MHNRFCIWKLGIVAILVLSFFVVISEYVHADNRIDNRKVVRIAYYEDSENFQGGAAPGKHKSGYAYEYYQKVAEYAGWRYEYAYGSWAECYEMMQRGEVDLIAGVSRTEERESFLAFPTMVMGTENYYIFVNKGEFSIKGNDYTTLNGKKIGVNKNSLMETYLLRFRRENQLDFEIITTEDHTQAFRFFQEGKIDAAAITDNYSMEGLKPIIYIGGSDYYIAVNKDKPDILEELNKAQETLFERNPSYIQELTQKYFGKNALRLSLEEEEEAWLENKSMIRIGCLNNLLPYCSLSAEGKTIGIIEGVIEYLKQFLEKPIGVTFYQSKEELKAALKNEEIDAIFPVYADLWENELEGLRQSDIVVQDRMLVVYKGDYSDDLFANIATYEGNISQQSIILNYYPNAEVKQYKNPEKMFEAIQQGEAQCCVGAGSILQRMLNNSSKFDDLSFAYADISDDFVFATAQRNKIFASILNKAIAGIDDHIIRSSMIKYTNGMADYSWENFLQHHIKDAILILIIVIIVASILLYLYFLQMRYNQESFRKAVETARRSEQAKSEFLSHMSHDIRTPINGIIGMLEIEEKNAENLEVLAECRSKIRTSSNHLLSLINDVLDMSRLSSGQVTLEHISFDLREVKESCCEILQPLVDEKNIIMIHADLEGIEYPYLIGSPLHLRQVLVNIISNAIKYNRPNGTVEVNVQQEKQSEHEVAVTIKIRDTGIGMSDEFMKHIFEPFSRENFGAGTTYTGTGLGMSIVKEIVNQMGGTIKVESTKDVGSIFTLWIPFFIGQEPKSEKVEEKKKGVDLSGVRALVVEDNEINMQIIEYLLKDAGVEITKAWNGEEAVEVFQNSEEGAFDVILMDVRMPVMDGLTATRAIRMGNHPQALSIPILAMTANAFKEDAEKCIAAGMNAHLAKPLNAKAVLTTIKENVVKNL